MHTISLSSLDQTRGFVDDTHHRGPKGGRQPSRKEARKQEREGRKQQKVHFYTSHVVQKPPQPKRAADNEHPDSPQRKKARFSQPTTKAAPTPPRVPAIGSESVPLTKPSGNSKKVPKGETPLEKASRRADAASKKARASTSAPAIAPRSGREGEEDAYIAYLESKLGYQKGGKRTTKHGQEDDDGLDGT